MSETRKYKTYSGDDVQMQVESGKREVISLINTDSVDADSEVVQPRGLKKKSFQGNPVVMVNHDLTKLPVGKCLWLKSGVSDSGSDVIIAKTRFSNATQDAQDVFALIQDDILKGFSVGFFPIRQSAPSTKEINARPDLKGCKNIIREWELYEYSVVGVPCNPDALSLAVSKGYKPHTLDIVFGKNANSLHAVNEIVEAAEHVEQKKFSDSDLYKFVVKHLDQVNIVVDPDKVVAAAMQKLRHVVK